MMSAKEYYIRAVLPMVDIFHEQQQRSLTDRRPETRDRVEATARAAAIALANVPDYLTVEQKGGAPAGTSEVEALRRALAPGVSAMEILNDVADATKHSRLRNESRFVTSATGIAVEYAAWDQVAWGEASWSEDVYVTRADRSESRSMAVLIDDAVAFWNRYFQV
ncbi:MAG: hypothetical protein IT566_07400 [Rhodospirillaceae bacterium]|nr:hypothetical protein [Rhodospirillaceae bacterium]